MNWFENGCEITRLMHQRNGPLDQMASRVSTDLQVQAGSTDLVLNHHGHPVLMLSGVDRIFVPLLQSNAERRPVEFQASFLLEIQIAQKKIEALK